MADQLPGTPHVWSQTASVSNRRTYGVAQSARWKAVTSHPAERVGLDPEGALHGIVFGDGTCRQQYSGARRCQVYLCNDPAGCDSRRLAALFEERGFHAVIREDHQQIRFYGLPGHWKTLPPITASPSYLRGFVAGWFAADGHIANKNPVASIASAQREHLEWLQRIAPRAGLAVSVNIGYRRSASTFGPTEWHSLGIALSTLNLEFFLSPEKRQRFQPAQFVKLWKVVSVVRTEIVEPVFTVRGVEGGQFSIEGNILVCSPADAL